MKTMIPLCFCRNYISHVVQPSCTTRFTCKFRLWQPSQIILLLLFIHILFLMLLWWYVTVLNIMLNLRIRILLYRLILAQVICKLHFIDLQYFLHKCPTTGSCQESDELILKLHRNVRYILILYFHICLMQVSSLLHITNLKFCFCISLLLCVVLAAFLDLLYCKYWLLRGVFFNCRTDYCRYRGGHYRSLCSSVVVSSTASSPAIKILNVLNNFIFFRSFLYNCVFLE